MYCGKKTNKMFEKSIIKEKVAYVCSTLSWLLNDDTDFCGALQRTDEWTDGWRDRFLQSGFETFSIDIESSSVCCKKQTALFRTKSIPSTLEDNSGNNFSVRLFNVHTYQVSSFGIIYFFTLKTIITKYSFYFCNTKFLSDAVATIFYNQYNNLIGDTMFNRTCFETLKLQHLKFNHSITIPLELHISLYDHFRNVGGETS